MRQPTYLQVIVCGNGYSNRANADTYTVSKTSNFQRVSVAFPLAGLEKVYNFCEQKKNACDKNVEVIGMDNMLTPP